jgi:long-chain fatty acid transport protein
MDIKPTLAYKVNKYLSVGGGLDIYTFADFLGEGQAELHTRSGPEFVPLGIPQNTPLEANGTDTALGFNASFLWTPFRNADKKPLVNVAFVYRSEADLDLDGDFLVNGKKFADASTTIELPDIYSGAIAVWPIRNSEREWKVEVDLDYADWSRFKNLDLELSNGITLPQPRNYDDSFVVMVGTEHKWLDMKSLPNWEIALRGGYVYSETPIPSNTFEPAVPDADYNAISIGLGMLCEEKGKFFGLIPCDGIGARAIGLDLAYQVLLYQTRGISDNINPAVNGEWDTTLHVGAINLRMNF